MNYVARDFYLYSSFMFITMQTYHTISSVCQAWHIRREDLGMFQVRVQYLYKAIKLGLNLFIEGASPFLKYQNNEKMCIVSTSKPNAFVI